jgi:ketosteroid isomerase-like protein
MTSTVSKTGSSVYQSTRGASIAERRARRQPSARARPQGTGRGWCRRRASDRGRGTGVTDAPAIDPLAVVEASPALVLRKDQAGWLALYTDDALIEDPVGAARYRGKQRIAAFWNVFIAPQERIVFHARREFVTPSLVVRQVRIESVTTVNPDPVNVEAIIEYRLRGAQIASMRAFWAVREPVAWHLQHGMAGLRGLVRHSSRLIGELGLGATLAFGRAMVPRLSARTGRALVESLVTAPREQWRQALAAASVRAVGLHGHPGPIEDLASLWTALRGDGSTRRVEAVTIGGSEVAAILTGGDAPDVAVIARVARGRIVELSLVGA